jgi:hypothetical protein
MEPKQKNPKVKPVPFVVVSVLAALTLYGAGKYVRGLFLGFNPSPQSMRPAQPAPMPAASVAGAAPGVSKPASREREWAAFREKFGSELKVEFGREGYATAIRGAPGSGRRGQSDFEPGDPQKAIARAREVLEAARDLLGLQPELPLAEPTAKTSEVSAQVRFQEMLDGVPLAPSGSVVVDLGPQGEVLNVYSDYARNVSAANQIKVTPEQAKAKAESVVPEPGSALGTIGGNAVVWVTRTGPEGTPVGRHAYDFNVAGRQVVVDAGNSDVIFRRDRRQF